jgi:recombination protein RecA
LKARKLLLKNHNMLKELEALRDELNKEFGEQYACLLSDDSVARVSTVSTGSIILDYLLRVGGFPKARIVELVGGEGSGKTTLALHALADYLDKHPEMGGVFVDAEHALNTEYAADLGVDLSRVLHVHPDCLEDAFESYEKACKNPKVGIAIFDSLAAAPTRKEISGDYTDANIGEAAKTTNRFLRQVTGWVKRNDIVSIIINQIREKPGVMFGSPETTPRGNGLKFHSSIRLWCYASTAIKAGKDEVIGHTMRIVCKKNKLGRPFKKAEIPLIWGEGIDIISEVRDEAVKYDLLKKSGSWFSYEGSNVAQGDAKMKQFLIDNPEVFELLKEQVLEKLNEPEL